MPRVSVILPTHNRPVLLAEALTSLQVQTFTGWEVLIVDDASTTPVSIDNGDKRIRVLHHSHPKAVPPLRTPESKVPLPRYSHFWMTMISMPPSIWNERLEYLIAIPTWTGFS
jgi:GT2 family glycosyltransferase